MRSNGNGSHAQAQPPIGSVTIRRLGDADTEALGRLAQRDSAEPLAGTLLGAEVEGVVLAAISLDTGELVADPFSRTNELRAMLELRAKQLRRPARLRRLVVRSTQPRAALGGSPPGAGGRLLSLAPRP